MKERLLVFGKYLYRLETTELVHQTAVFCTCKGKVTNYSTYLGSDCYEMVYACMFCKERPTRLALLDGLKKARGLMAIL